MRTASSIWIGSVSWNSSSSSRWYRSWRAARTTGPCCGSRSTFRARTSRSWNSRVPAARRCSAASRVLARSAVPRRWAQPSSTVAANGLHRLDDHGELREDGVLAAAPRRRLAAVLPVAGQPAERLEQVEVVGARGGEHLGELAELVHGHEELVGLVDALAAELGERAELSVDLRHEIGDPGRVGALIGNEVFHEVP